MKELLVHTIDTELNFSKHIGKFHALRRIRKYLSLKNARMLGKTMHQWSAKLCTINMQVLRKAIVFKNYKTLKVIFQTNKSYEYGIYQRHFRDIYCRFLLQWWEMATTKTLCNKHEISVQELCDPCSLTPIPILWPYDHILWTHMWKVIFTWFKNKIIHCCWQTNAHRSFFMWRSSFILKIFRISAIFYCKILF